MGGISSATSLVVGGTGMLSKATHWLAARSGATILVARHASRFAPGDDRFIPFDLDWHRSTFVDELCSAMAANGPIGSALLWLHDPESTLRRLAPHIGGARVVVVLGSLSGQPVVPETAAHLVTVRLGSKPAVGGGRRWLTDDEICEGAIAALDDGRSRVVGELLSA